MGNISETQSRCPACGIAVPAKIARCKCGHAFAHRRPVEPADLIELQEIEELSDEDLRSPAIGYDIAGLKRSAPRSAAIADVTRIYPQRIARPVVQEAAVESSSLFRNIYVPVMLIAVGAGLRFGQLMYANDGRGNRWAGNLHTPGGIGKATLLVLFEMIIASAIMTVGAVIAAMLLNVEFGSPVKAVLKCSASAVFATGIVSWVALFDQGAFSIGGLVLGLHVMVVIYWIVMGYFFSLELQELLLTVAIITLLHSVAILGLWRGS